MSAASTPSQRFPREARLLRRADFQRVYENGRKHFSANMTVFYQLRGGEPERQETSTPQRPRVGITVGRAVGKAVERVRIKRRIRNAIRPHLYLLLPPLDVVINPKRSALHAEFAALRDEIRRTFETLNEKGQMPGPRARADGRRNHR